MRKIMTAALGFAGGRQPRSAATASAATAPAKAATKHAAAAAHSASGTIESYDAAAHTLTVKGAKASWTFSTADAKAWMGSKSVPVDDLSTHSGAKVSVKYTEKDGQKAASTVRVSAPAAKKAS